MIYKLVLIQRHQKSYVRHLESMIFEEAHSSTQTDLPRFVAQQHNEFIYLLWATHQKTMKDQVDIGVTSSDEDCNMRSIQ